MSDTGKRALVIGATGLVGQQLLHLLLADDQWREVRVLARRSTGLKHDKLQEFLVDFNAIHKHAEAIEADVLFSVLGTTLKTAGSKEKQYAVDFGMQYNVAELAAERGVKTLVLLSSAGANAGSRVFYSRMKGELDEAVKSLKFQHVHIIRPSMLVGKRKEFRLTERLFTPVMYAFSWVPGIRKYRPIKDAVVAKAMIQIAKNGEENYSVHELESVFKLAGK